MQWLQNKEYEDMVTDYYFTHLSGYEFELLVRDLLQKQLEINLESFKTGRDGGIDLRHCQSIDQTTIIQCKRYVESDFDDLFKSAACESQKLPILKPQRYLFCTSLGLLPQQKDKLFSLFQPYCRTPGDIYGREDLNNLLGQHPEIERAHHKLWLHSFEVLRTVFHSSILNLTSAEMERIDRKRCYYVPTKTFEEALAVLEENRYCVITGIPGIGKTTLAEMLIISHAASGYQIIKISEDISEAFALYDKSLPQLFYYDDFLGQTGLQTKLGKNEDDRLTAFITLVQNSTNARFLLTTREYILKQAQSDYERLSRFNFQKCVLEPPKYTEYQRARILYNHLYFSKVPNSHKVAILKDKSYIKLVNHRGFNPRLISIMTDAAAVSTIQEAQYVQRFITLLDNPEDIWSHAFRHQISQAAKDLLLVLVTLPRIVLLNDLESAYTEFHYARSERYATSTTPNDFRNALEEIEDTFLKLDTIQNGSAVTVEFHNPSIRDFMENYLANSKVDVAELVELAHFFEQLEFLCSPNPREPVRRSIRSKATCSQHLPSRLVHCFDNPSAHPSFSYSSSKTWPTELRQDWSIEERLWLLVKVETFDVHSHELTKFISLKLATLMTHINKGEGNREELIELFLALDAAQFDYLLDEERDEFIDNCKSFLCSDLTDFHEFKMVTDCVEKASSWSNHDTYRLGRDFEHFLKTEEDELIKDSEFEDKIATARDIARILHLSLDSVLDRIEERHYKMQKEEEYPHKRPIPIWTPVIDPQAQVDAQIKAMFDSLT